MRRSLPALIMVLVLACTTDSADPTAAPTVAPSTSLTPTTTVAAPSTTQTSFAVTTTTPTTEPVAIAPEDLVLESFPVPAGSGPHDVAPAVDGGVWYTAQDTGELGMARPRDR